MKENTMARDVSPEKVKAAVAGMSFEDKLFANALMQMGFAYEAAKNKGKAEENTENCYSRMIS